jgi:hypothetical protein
MRRCGGIAAQIIRILKSGHAGIDIFIATGVSFSAKIDVFANDHFVKPRSGA